MFLFKYLSLESTKEMTKICKNSEIEQEKMCKEAKSAKESYESILKTNKMQEKKLREKKYLFNLIK